MAYFWVQQWWALPIIVEGYQMDEGQFPGGRLPQGRITGSVGQTGRGNENDGSSMSGRHNPVYTGHPSALTSQSYPDDGSSTNLPSQSLVTTNVPPQRPGSGFTMDSMMAALPDYRAPMESYGLSQAPQRFPLTATSPLIIQQQQQRQNLPHFGGPGSLGSAPYNVAFQSHFGSTHPQAQAIPLTSPQFFSPQHSGQPNRSAMTGQIQTQFGGAPFYSGQQQLHQPYGVYPSSYGQVNPSQPNLAGSQRVQESPLDMPVTGFQHASGYSPSASTGYGYGSAPPFIRPGNVSSTSRETSGPNPSALPSSPRGPPRKPKQSGHALWVGNLPPGALVTELKDHFAREATNSIESVFLISKSNCAFVNYRTEEACAAAMARFHDSRFKGVRLVCRLRRNSTAPAPGVPTGPAALAPVITQAQSATDAIQQNREISSKAEESARSMEGSNKINDKYFIVKSLTVEDLELSARNGIWATQSHNEDALNKAFEAVENVFLIFSANKSGEYFGYARMTSRISEDEAANLEWTPRVEAIPEDPELPRSIPTARTEFAPKGRIIDDSARGTIFWEADPTDQEPAIMVNGEDARGDEANEEPGASDPPSLAQSFGKPFKIKWISTERLPFYRTRGLRNPWNANREVKIARDGTELETSVGRRLVQMFHRPLQNSSASQPLPGIAMQMGYQHMRPY